MKLMMKNIRLRNMKMSSQIMGIMIITALIPLLILSISINSKTRNQAAVEAKKQLSQDITYIEESLKNSIMNSVETIKLIKSQTKIQEIFQDINTGRLQKYTDEFNDIVNLFEGVVDDSNELYERVLIADQYGNTISDISREKDSYNLLSISGKDYFLKLKDNNTYIGNSIISTVTHRAVTPISMKISQNDEMLGVIVIYFDLETLTRLFQKINNNAGTALLLDEKGHYLYNMNTDLILTRWEGYNELKEKEFFTYTQNDKTYYGKAKRIEELNWTIIPLIGKAETYSMIDGINDSLIFITVLLIIFIVVIATVYAKLVTKPISFLSRQMQSVLNGNLNQAVKYNTNKEITILNNNFIIMIDYLKDIISGITKTSEMLNNSSAALSSDTLSAYEYTSNVNDSLDMIGKESIKQEDSIQGGLKILKSLTSEINVITLSTDKIKKSFEISNEIILEGNKSIETLKNKSRESSKISMELLKLMEVLTDSVLKIENISDVITDISKQTDLVAINATIEAARAGESGKSFAIVAKEIKRLSEIIGSETNSISDITKDLKKRSSMLKNNIINNKHIIDIQNTAVINTEESLKNIITHSESMILKTKDIINSINQINDNSEYIKIFTVNISNNLKYTVGKISDIIASAQNQFAVIEELKTESIKLREQSTVLIDITSIFTGS